MYYNGAEGDQAPQGRPDAGNSRWERAERYGRDLGIVAWKQWQQTKTSPSRLARLSLAHDRAARADLASRLHEDRRGRIWPEREAASRKCCRGCFPRRSTAISLRLGDLLIVGIPGEMAASLGMKIKSRGRAHHRARSTR